MSQTLSQYFCCVKRSLCRSQVWEYHQRTKYDTVQFYCEVKANVLQMTFSLIKLCLTLRQINDICWVNSFRALKAILWQDFKMFSSKRILFKTASIDFIMCETSRIYPTPCPNQSTWNCKHIIKTLPRSRPLNLLIFSRDFSVQQVQREDWQLVNWDILSVCLFFSPMRHSC